MVFLSFLNLLAQCLAEFRDPQQQPCFAIGAHINEMSNADRSFACQSCILRGLKCA
jgi:hypothetical protein